MRNMDLATGSNSGFDEGRAPTGQVLIQPSFRSVVMAVTDVVGGMLVARIEVK